MPSRRSARPSKWPAGPPAPRTICAGKRRTVDASSAAVPQPEGSSPLSATGLQLVMRHQPADGNAAFQPLACDPVRQLLRISLRWDGRGARSRTATEKDMTKTTHMRAEKFLSHSPCNVLRDAGSRRACRRPQETNSELHRDVKFRDVFRARKLLRDIAGGPAQMSGLLR